MCGALWALECYPNGNKDENRGYLGIFIRVNHYQFI